MEIKKLTALHGWTWIKQGYQLLMRSPILALSTALIGAMGILLAMMLPYVGPLLAVLLMPVLLAGYMRICRALEQEEEVELTDLFAGFKRNTPSLITLGAMLMMGMLVASMVMVAVGGDALTALMEQVQTANDPQVLMDALSNADGNIAFAVLLGFSLMFVLIMAWQFAPMLVFFSDLTPFAALHASFLGTLRNILPYMVYSLLTQILAVLLGVLPYGVGLILLLPLGLASLYVSYRNIFPWLDVPAAPAVVEASSHERNKAEQ